MLWDPAVNADIKRYWSQFQAFITSNAFSYAAKAHLTYSKEMPSGAFYLLVGIEYTLEQMYLFGKSEGKIWWKIEWRQHYTQAVMSK